MFRTNRLSDILVCGRRMSEFWKCFCNENARGTFSGMSRGKLHHVFFYMYYVISVFVAHSACLWSNLCPRVVLCIVHSELVGCFGFESPLCRFMFWNTLRFVYQHVYLCDVTHVCGRSLQLVSVGLPRPVHTGPVQRKLSRFVRMSQTWPLSQDDNKATGMCSVCRATR